MEYQQFINFLKAKHCYDKFLEMHSKYPNTLLGNKKLTVKERFLDNPRIIIASCISFVLIYGKEGEDAYIFWGELHKLWMDKYLKK